MAEERVVGYNPSSTPAEAGTLNYTYCGRYQAIASASGVTKLMFYCGVASGNVKVGVFSDNAGEPDARLGYNDSGQAVSASSWNELSISSMSVVSGTYYWLCAISDTGNVISRDNTGGDGTWEAQTYATWTWNNPIGLTSPTDSVHLYGMYLLGETGGGGSENSYYYLNNQ
jgi:hypothetical protein